MVCLICRDAIVPRIDRSVSLRVFLIDVSNHFYSFENEWGMRKSYTIAYTKCRFIFDNDI